MEHVAHHGLSILPIGVGEQGFVRPRTGPFSVDRAFIPHKVLSSANDTTPQQWGYPKKLRRDFMNDHERRQIALFRYELIVPLLQNVHRGALQAQLEQAAKRTGLTPVHWT